MHPCLFAPTVDLPSELLKTWRHTQNLFCLPFASLLHLKAKPSWMWIGTAKNSTYPKRHQLNRRSIYLPANSLSSPKMRETTPSPILVLSYSLAISMISQPWRVKHCALFRYDGPSPISPSRSKTFFSGYAKLDQALEYVEALLPEQEVIQGARRVTLRMFPHMALRELLANMLIHQDFSITGTGPMICIFDGRIEFTNPGSSLVDVARLLNNPLPSFAQRKNGSYLPMTNASLRKRFDLPASGASQVSRLIKTCISSNLLKIADPDAGKRYVRYLPYWA